MAKIWSAAFAALIVAVAVSVAAQEPQTSRSSMGKTITVSGCVQRAAETPTGTSGTTPATRSTSETKFVLKSASSSGTATTGTAGTAGAAAANEYRLDADDAKLTPHVGHKVEISGTLDESAKETTPGQPATGAASSASAPKLKVDTVRMISSTCS
jgi:hypothetical protein